VKIPKSLISINSFILITFLAPVIYMLWRFINFSRSLGSFFQSWDVFGLLFNTVSVFFAVVLSSLLIGLLISIVTVRFEFPGSKIMFTLCALPLVIPSYIGALTYISAFSPKGLFVQIFSSFGLDEIRGIEGFLGSWLVLTLFTYPYVQLICSSALRNLDSTVEDAARSLGVNQLKVYTNVVIPRLKKPIIYSGLLVGLYVISDFGAVSLMRYSTVTKAIYAYYEFSILGDPVIFYSSLLIVLALIISFVQRGSATSRSAKVSGTPRIPKKIKLDNLPYRLELISKNIINDSKSTNFHSLSYALNKVDDLFKDQEYILIVCGNPEKEGHRKVSIEGPKEVLIFGEHSKELDGCINHPRKTIYISLEDVFNNIKGNKSYKNILFSPGYPSGNDFKDYIQRGEHFNSLVKKHLS